MLNIVSNCKLGKRKFIYIILLNFLRCIFKDKNVMKL